MEIGICLLGYGSVGKEVYRQLTGDSRYGTDIQVKTIQVTDVSKHSGKILDGGGWVLDNQYLTSIGDDVDSLLESTEYNVIVDASSYNKDSRDLILELLSRGHWLYTCSKELAGTDFDVLLESAASGGGRIDFNSIPSSDTKTKYSNVDLNHSNWRDYVSDPEMFIFRNGGPKETAKIIVSELYKELDARRGA
jgi:homoserine dehydrogenase